MNINIRKKLYQIIRSSSDNEHKLSRYDIFMMIMIILSVFPLMFKQTSEYELMSYIENVSVGIFFVDYLLRWIVADYEYSELKKPFISYFYQPMAIIDICSIIPYLLVMFLPVVPEMMTLLLLRLTRLARGLRSLKILKYSKSFKVLSLVIKESIEPLKMVFALTISYIFISALIIFNIENEFENFFEALYWATVSLTTVGYGDIVPKTVLGRFMTMISSIIGVAVIALPSAIVTAGYMKYIGED